MGTVERPWTELISSLLSLTLNWFRIQNLKKQNYILERKREFVNPLKLGLLSWEFRAKASAARIDIFKRIFIFLALTKLA